MGSQFRFARNAVASGICFYGTFVDVNEGVPVIPVILSSAPSCSPGSRTGSGRAVDRTADPLAMPSNETSVGTPGGAAVSVEKRQDLLTLADLLATGQVTPVIDRTYPLDEAADALRYVGAGHTQGKVVVTVTTGPTRTTHPVRVHAQTCRHSGRRTAPLEGRTNDHPSEHPNLLDNPPSD
jgi:Zinc-binding dehydrogenase